MLLTGQTTARHPDLLLLIIVAVIVLLVLANIGNWLKTFDAWLLRRFGGR
jgi:hypothetical protein